MILRALRNTMSAELISSCLMVFALALLADFGVHPNHAWQMVLGLPPTIAVYLWIKRH